MDKLWQNLKVEMSLN